MPGHFRAALAALLIAGWCTSRVQGQSAAVKLTPEEIRGSDGDRTNHFGDSPDNPGPIAADLEASLTSPAVIKAMHKVADWQLGRAQRYFNQQWTFGTLYHGFLAASASTGDPKFHDAMVAMAEQFHWDIQRPGAGPPPVLDLNPPPLDAAPPPPPPTAAVIRQTPLNANSECLAQAYLDLYSQYLDPRMMQPTQTALDDVMHIDKYPITPPGRGGPGRGGAGRGGAATRPGGDQGTDPGTNPHHILWWWCDALYMAPPAWTKLYKITGQTKYLDYLDHQWWITSDALYDPSEHLYFRDNSFVAKRESNGQKMFWSRGNGWVMGGLARLIPDLPAGYPSRARYVTQFQEMAAKVASLQGPDGLWRAGMLDPDFYGLPENSGSAFFCYALAWGVNQKLLDSDLYEPVVARAWKGLLAHVHADGRLDCIQQTGSGPAHFEPSSSYVYGVGGSCWRDEK